MGDPLPDTYEWYLENFGSKKFRTRDEFIQRYVSETTYSLRYSKIEEILMEPFDAIHGWWKSLFILKKHKEGDDTYYQVNMVKCHRDEHPALYN